MANIRVYAPGLQSSGEEFRDALIAAGHTVTFGTASGIGSPSGFDALVVQHGTAITLSQVQAFINAGLGVVVVDSGNGSGRGAGQTTVTNHVLLGLALASAYSRERPSSSIAELAGHFITDGLADPQGYLASGTTTQGVLDLPLINGGAAVPILALGDQGNGTVDDGAAVAAFEKGLVYSNAGTLEGLPVRIAWLGAAGVIAVGNGDPTGYNAAGNTLAVKSVEWVLGLSTAVDPIAAYSAWPVGNTVDVVDGSAAVAPGATIVGWYYSLDGGAQTSRAQNPRFIASAGSYTLEQVVWDSNGNSSYSVQTLTFGEGSSLPPYDLPTEKVAGRFLIALDSTQDWTGVTGVVLSTEGKPFLDYYKVPKPGSGSECRVKDYEITDHADQPVRTMRADLALTGKAGSLSVLATDSDVNRLAVGSVYSAAVFGAREILIQNALGDPDSTDPDDWRPRFHGYLDDPKSSWVGNVSLFARDCASALMVAYRGPEVWIGVEGETIALGDAIQAVLDATQRPGLWRLKVEEDLAWEIDAFPLRNVDDVLAFISKMARQRGAVVRWWFDGGVYGTQRFQLQLFVLQVDKETPDYTFAANQVKDAPESATDTTNVRNDIYLDFVPEGQTEAVTIRRPPTQAEIATYRVKPLWIGTQDTKHIKDVAAANVMMDSIDGAVRLPAMVGSKIIRTSGSDIEINSLLEFGADGRIADESLPFYVGGWTERVSASGESQTDEIETALRNGPVGQIRQWFRNIAGLPDDEKTTKLPPVWNVATRTSNGPSVGTFVGTVCVAFERRGLALLEVRAKTKLPEKPYGPFEAMDRSHGAWSVVHERELGIDEYEKDVDLLGGDAQSQIFGECDVEGVTIPIFLFEVSLDANSEPDIVGVDLNGLVADVKADDDTASVHVVKTSGPGSPYSDSFDSNRHSFTIPVGSGDTWELEATAKNTLIADPDDKVSAPFPFTVTNNGAPTLTMVAPEPPADGFYSQDFVDVVIADAPVGAGFRIYERHATTPLGGTTGNPTAWKDITSELSPSPTSTGLPVTPTTYQWATAYTRNDAFPLGTVTFEFRWEIVSSAGEVLASNTAPITYSYPYVPS